MSAAPSELGGPAEPEAGGTTEAVEGAPRTVVDEALDGATAEIGVVVEVVLVEVVVGPTSVVVA